MAFRQGLAAKAGDLTSGSAGACSGHGRCASSGLRGGCRKAPPARWPPGCVTCVVLGAPVTDARAEEVAQVADGPLPAAVRGVLATLDPAVAADDEVVAAVLVSVEELDRP